MLNILLIILKAVGITAAVLLGLIVLLLLMILFVPVRYSARGSYADDVSPRLEMDITWLMRVLSGRIRYEDELSYELRIFGKVVESSDAEAPDQGSEAEIAELETAETGIAETETAGTEIREAEAAVDRPPAAELSEAHQQEGVKPQVAAADETGELDKPTDHIMDSDIADENSQAKTAKNNSKTQEYRRQGQPKNQGSLSGKAPQRSASRIRRLLRGAFDGAKRILSGLMRFARRLCENRDGVTAFLRDQGHRRAISLLWSSLRRLLRHIWPQRLDGHLTFGFEDPSVTGYVLAMLSVLMSGGKNDMTVIPFFDRRCMDCEASIKGKLRLIVPISIALKIYTDEDCKRLYSEVTNGGK